MQKVIPFLFILAVVCTNCGGKTRLTQNNYYLPGKYKFRLKDKFELSDTTFLSITSLYQNNCYKDQWFKFFKDGKVVYGYDSNVPRYPGEPFTGYAGYYTLDQDHIKIELTYSQKKNDWYILNLEGNIKDGKLFFIADRPRGINRNIEHFTNNSAGCQYAKTNITYQLLQPDW